MHRACVDRALRNRLSLGQGGGLIEIARRVGDKLRAATLRAEIVRLPAVRRRVLGRVRVDGHAAHRILHSIFVFRLFAEALEGIMVVVTMPKLRNATRMTMAAT